MAVTPRVKLKPLKGFSSRVGPPPIPVLRKQKAEEDSEPAKAPDPLYQSSLRFCVWKLVW
jgi:hypothetical protein